MKKYILPICISISLLLSACAGKTPNPVPQYQSGDERMSCSRIKQEIMYNQSVILGLVPKANKTNKNVALGVAGYLLLVPWFFMDFSDAERVEIQGHQLRNNYLRLLAEKKKCKTKLPPPVKFATR